MLDAVVGNFKSSAPKYQMSKTQEQVFKQVWPTIHEIVTKADDSVNVAFKDKDTAEKVDEVLQQVADGELTADEGKKLISLISMGIEAQEIPKLVKALEDAGI